MPIVFVLITVQFSFILIAVFVLKKFWDKELIREALEQFAACPASPEVKEISVRSSSRISEEFKNRIESIHQRKYVQASLNIQEDPSLKGGIIITVGGLSLDYSLS
jgi:F0F1-type ATP synthase delta subunit